MKHSRLIINIGLIIIFAATITILILSIPYARDFLKYYYNEIETFPENVFIKQYWESFILYLTLSILSGFSALFTIIIGVFYNIPFIKKITNRPN